MHFLLWIKRSHQSPNFETYECSGENFPNSSCYFSSHKSVFLQILHHSSVSWDITPLYFLDKILYTFNKRSLSKYKFGEISREQSKVQNSALWWALFIQSIIRFELKKYRGVVFHDTEQCCKTWINPDIVVSQMAWGIVWTFIRALKSLKNCTLMSSFCSKHIMFQLKNFKGIMCHDTEGWCKIYRKTDSWLEKWHEKFGEF